MTPLKNSRRHHRPDYVLALTVGILMAIGLVMMYSVSPVLSYKLLGSESNYYFIRQLLSLGIGLAAWAIASAIYYERWRSFSPALVILAALALLALFIPQLSMAKNGATRWLNLGPLSFQPAELLKLAVVLYLAAWFERRGEAIKTFWDGLFPFGVALFVISIIVVVFQRDLGTMLVIALAATGMYWVAGLRLKHLAVLAGAALVGGWISIVSFAHRMERLKAFLDPSHDTGGVGYHINQALIAVGSGGLFGLGLGKSIQIYGYLPEASNDSIFAIIAEEFGLVGSLFVLVLFGILAYRGLKIAKFAPNLYSRLVAAGISLWILFQALINIAAMLALVPLTGIPLPFISFGGTSLVFTLFGVGILMNISKYTVKEASYALSRERRGNRWPHLANSGYSRRPKIAR